MGVSSTRLWIWDCSCFAGEELRFSVWDVMRRGLRGDGWRTALTEADAFAAAVLGVCRHDCDSCSTVLVLVRRDR